jgi:choline dehydrogenase-like flavoprotein
MIWDYIIVGAGSAGCALAYELARAPGRPRILILEAGKAGRSPFVRIPAGQILAVGRYGWGYQAHPDPSRGGVAERWFGGRVLGGSSSINGTVFVRGAAHDFDRWNALCGYPSDCSWAAEPVMKIFRDMESSDHPGISRGHQGPLHVRTVNRPHLLTRAYMEAAKGCGYRITDDYNGAVQEGVALAQLTQRNGLRCSSADAFLKPLLSSKTVTLSLQSAVERVELQNGRAVAVVFTKHGRTCTESSRNIIICAGAIATPRLLMLSGIGDPEELTRHGIAVRLPLPGVGRNLMEHPLVRLTFRTSVPTYNLTKGLLQKADFARQFLLTREGPLSNLFESVAFLRTSPAQAVPDIQLHFIPLGYLAKPNGSLELASFPSVTILLNKSYPQSVSRIRLSGASPGDPPLIEPRLLASEADLDTLAEGVGIVRAIMQRDPISKWITEEVAPGSSVASLTSLREYIRNHTAAASHASGTCRMGRMREAVVDPNLRVVGAENLWIADASVMPDLISGNTNAACMMIGLKLGRQFAHGDAHATR